MKLPSDLPAQARTGGSWFAGVVLYCHRMYVHPATVYHQTVATVHAMQNEAQMRMTLDEEVTHVICYRCECHPITIDNVVKSLHAAGYNTLLVTNTLIRPYSNSIPIVYTEWIKDSDSQGILFNYRDYFV